MTHLPDSSPENLDRPSDRQLLLEALAGREFTLADVIGQAGGDFLKGESPVPKLVQLKTELKLFISQNLDDVSGALQGVLQLQIDQADEQITLHLEEPLWVLKKLIEKLLANAGIFYDFVHQVDFKWGQMYEERPLFQLPGASPHPDDEYTHESVKRQLTDLLAKVDRALFFS
ncbi:MAG: hypothetical protein ACRC6M_08495 [Microcystaceae cyanobacterium]